MFRLDVILFITLCVLRKYLNAATGPLAIVLLRERSTMLTLVYGLLVSGAPTYIGHALTHVWKLNNFPIFL